MSRNNLITERDDGLNYGRVSDDKQSGLSSQMPGLMRLAQRHNVNIVAEVTDDGESGDDLAREGLQKVMAILRRAHKAGRPIKWLFTDKSDRLSRADSLPTSRVLADMRDLGVHKVATPVQVFDLYNEMDKLQLQIETDFKNHKFLKDLGRVVLAGMLAAAMEGFWIGGKPPFGYRVLREPGAHAKRGRTSGKLVVDEANALLVVELYHRYDAGESGRSLARWLSARRGKKVTRRGVEYILSNERYTGTAEFGKRTSARHARLVDGIAEPIPTGATAPPGDTVHLTLYPQIIETDLFLRVQHRLRTGRSRSQKKNVPITPLAGLTRCGCCGSTLRSARQGKNGYLRCSRKTEDNSVCDSRLVRGDEVLRRVFEVLQRELLQGDTMAKLQQLAGQAEAESQASWEADVKATTDALEATERKLATVRTHLDGAPADMIEDCWIRIRALKAEKEQLLADLARLRMCRPADEAPAVDALNDWLIECTSACREGSLQGMDPEAQHALMSRLVAEVHVWPVRVRKRNEPTVERIKVILPVWFKSVLGRTAGHSSQHANPIALTWAA